MNSLKKQSGNAKTIAVLLVVLTIVLATCIVVTLVKNDDGAEWTDATEDNTVAFNTPAGRLTYPLQRAEYARIEETTNGTSYSGTLYGEVDKKEYKLFSVYINEKPLDSFLLGNVTDASGQTYSINIEIEDLEMDDSRSDIDDEDKDLLYAMQEDVNYIVEQIGLLPGFTPAY